MIVLVGASASGKTELAKILFKSYGYTKCITTTTRNPRIQEVNDVDYHFLSEQDFLDLKALDAFLEVSIYNGNYYGFQKRDMVTKGVVVVDPNGANSIIEYNPNKAFIVYIKSTKQTRKKRMIDRGDDMNIINERLDNDQRVFIKSRLKRIDLLIENEDHHLSEIAEEIHNKYMKFMGL